MMGPIATAVTRHQRQHTRNWFFHLPSYLYVPYAVGCRLVNKPGGGQAGCVVGSEYADFYLMRSRVWWTHKISGQ